MLREVRPFQSADVHHLAGFAGSDWLDFDVAGFAAAGNAFTLWQDGQAVFCGGARERHAGWATLWSVWSAERPVAPVWLTRTTRRFIADLPHRRIDAMVACCDDRAMAWAEFAGLEMEAVLAGASPEGGNMAVFVRRQG